MFILHLFIKICNSFDFFNFNICLDFFNIVVYHKTIIFFAGDFMKKNSLFLCIGLVILSLIIMVSFAGCKGSNEASDSSSSNTTSLTQGDDATTDDANEQTDGQDDSNNSDSNVYGTGSNKQDGTNSNNSTVQEGQDVVIDFGEEDEIDVSSSNNNSNSTNSNNNNNNNNNTNSNSSNDGWTGDYIIK